MRGPSGAGKSTLARKILGDHMEVGVRGVIFSTDEYFVLCGDGVYKFLPERIKAAHEWNKKRFREAVFHRVPLIIIDNTNTTPRECFDYVSFAHDNGYGVEFREPETPWKWDVNELVSKNTHGVSRDTIERMLARYVHGLTVEQVLAYGDPPETRTLRAV